MEKKSSFALAKEAFVTPPQKGSAERIQFPTERQSQKTKGKKETRHRNYGEGLLL